MGLIHHNWVKKESQPGEGSRSQSSQRAFLAAAVSGQEGDSEDPEQAAVKNRHRS